MTDDQTEPGRSVRRHARPAQPGPEPPWPGDGAGAPAHPDGQSTGYAQPTGYGQPAAAYGGPDAEGTVPGSYGRSPDTTGTVPSSYGRSPGATGMGRNGRSPDGGARPAPGPGGRSPGGPVAGGPVALPPGGRHAGQGDGADRPGGDSCQQNMRPGPDEPGAYQGQRQRSEPPGPGGPAGYRGRRQRNAPPEPDESAAYRGRRHRDEPPGPDRPAGPGGPPRQDSYDDGYEEDDRFVPGLGGPRYRDDDDGYDDGDNEDGDGGGAGPKRRRSRWIAPLIAVVVILTPLVIGGVYVYGLYMSKYHPADYVGGGTSQAIVEVQSGQTATQVGQRLVTLGVVKSVRAFELAAEHSTDSRGLEPGFYRMHNQMQATLAFALLLSPAARIEDKITIPEGWRLSQIETTLGAKSGIPLADYQQALASPGSLGLPSYANGHPEGYLFPATYDVQPNMTATTVLQAMINRFTQEAVNINLNAAAAQAHMTPGQVITVASLLQAEGGRVSDYPKIARVVLNRLRANMPLQFDSTVFYGLHQFGTSATFKQIDTNTPYNTYMHKGLPPGPIDSPGNAAIQAALHPASGDWLYFVAKNGLTTFSRTQP